MIFIDNLCRQPNREIKLQITSMQINIHLTKYNVNFLHTRSKTYSEQTINASTIICLQQSCRVTKIHTSNFTLTDDGTWIWTSPPNYIYIYKCTRKKQTNHMSKPNSLMVWIASTEPHKLALDQQMIFRPWMEGYLII